MGRLAAEGFAEEVRQGHVSLEAALTWHLQANHFEPIPTAFVPTAVAAIELAQAEEWDSNVDLPIGITKDGSSQIKVWEVVEVLHLDAFLGYEEDEG